jgi:AGCS family alanine or glycine:cation symporter
MDFANILDTLENFLWIYMGVPVLMVLGLLLSFRSRFFQVRKFPVVCRTFVGFLFHADSSENGVHPLKAFFACIGGCVGIGNVVGICTAVQIGGPGALFWIWVTAIVGMILKYSEVYLGFRFRRKSASGSYLGGPMFFLQEITKSKWVPLVVSFLLCIYGVEVYQFSIVTSSISHNFNVSKLIIVPLLVSLVIFAGSGGVRRVGNISSAIIPFFIVMYTMMGGWVLFQNYEKLPAVLQSVFVSAFTGSGAVGGFVGSSLMLAISQGVRRGCYTGDVGVGYASVIHSESSSDSAEKQASLVIFDVFIDTFIICTTSVMLILVTGIWHSSMDAGLLVQYALGEYFPWMHFFMPLFLFLLGYSTINAYFCVGLKCAKFLSPRYGAWFFYLYSVPALVTFSFFDSVVAQSLMAISGGLLLIINSWGIWGLRDQISFSLDEKESKKNVSVTV